MVQEPKFAVHLLSLLFLILAKKQHLLDLCWKNKLHTWQNRKIVLFGMHVALAEGAVFTFKITNFLRLSKSYCDVKKKRENCFCNATISLQWQRELLVWDNRTNCHTSIWSTKQSQEHHWVKGLQTAKTSFVSRRVGNWVRKDYLYVLKHIGLGRSGATMLGDDIGNFCCIIAVEVSVRLWEKALPCLKRSSHTLYQSMYAKLSWARKAKWCSKTRRAADSCHFSFSVLNLMEQV